LIEGLGFIKLKLYWRRNILVNIFICGVTVIEQIQGKKGG
jgi:hypothetical protein